MTVTPRTGRRDTARHGEQRSWGVALGKVLDGTDALGAARLAERAGFDEVWVSNERMHRDMFAVLGAIAATTDTVRLGTFVSDPYTMHPLVTAAAVATVDQLSAGRAMLAVGAGGSGFAEMGIGATKPLGDLRMMITALRDLLAGERVSCSTDGFEIHDAELAVGPVSAPKLVLASQSPKMLRMGGEIADEVMISTFAEPRLFEMAIRWAAEGATGAGRAFDVGEQVIARIDLSIDTNPAVARNRLRPLIGYLLVLLHPRWWFLDVLEIELPSELVDAASRKDFAAMRARLELIPDALIDAFGWCGTPSSITESITRLEDLGVRRFVVLPHAEPRGFGAMVESFAGIVTDGRGTAP